MSIIDKVQRNSGIRDLMKLKYCAKNIQDFWYQKWFLFYKVRRLKSDMTWKLLGSTYQIRYNKIIRLHDLLATRWDKRLIETQKRVLDLRLRPKWTLKLHAISTGKVQCSSKSIMYARLRFRRGIVGLPSSPIWHSTLDSIARIMSVTRNLASFCYSAYT